MTLKSLKSVLQQNLPTLGGFIASSYVKCQGLEGPWHMVVLMDRSRVAEHMSIHPSAYEASHSIPLAVYIEEGITLMDALY